MHYFHSVIRQHTNLVIIDIDTVRNDQTWG